jgi:hypothetical protein
MKIQLKDNSVFRSENEKRKLKARLTSKSEVNNQQVYDPLASVVKGRSSLQKMVILSEILKRHEF